jgi:hypothetical protein
MCSKFLETSYERGNISEELSKRRIRRSMLLIKNILDITETQGIGTLKSHSCIIPGEELSVTAMNDITLGINIP